MSTVHVVPIGDLIDHQPAPPEADHGWYVTHHDSDGCACGPAVELVPNPAGPDGWLVIHHSLDGREGFE